MACLKDIYLDHPGNYVVRSNFGGAGKTCQLVDLYRELVESKDYVNYLPIFISLASFNYMGPVSGEVLFRYVSERYFHDTSTRELKQWIAEQNQLRFVFFLDGFNELDIYNVSGALQSNASVFVLEDILSLTDFDNVDVIISTRGDCFAEMDRDHVLQDRFSVYYLDRLQENQIDQYLGVELPTELGILSSLRVPMLLKMYRDLLRENRDEVQMFKTRYELIAKWTLLEAKKAHREIDNAPEIGQYVTKHVLPFIAFHTVHALLLGPKREYEELLTTCVQDNPLPPSIRMSGVEEWLRENNYIGLDFPHDIVRAYFAVNYFLGDKVTSKERESFLHKLTDQIRYVDNEPNEGLLRRTRFFDVAELMYAAFPQVSVENYYQKIHMVHNKPMGYRYMYELSGLYESVQEYDMAKETGWIAVGLMQQLPIDGLESAKQKSFLYYSVVKNSGKDSKDPLFLLEEALATLKSLQPEMKEDKEYCVNYGKVLSNLGAYYMTQFCYSIEKAYQWHQKALEWRLECVKNFQDFMPFVLRSYRTLFHDCVNMKRYERGYEYYKEGLNLVFHKPLLCKLDDLFGETEKMGLEQSYVNVQIYNLSKYILSNDVKEELLPEIQEEMSTMIPYVYTMCAVNSARPVRSGIKNLHDNCAKLIDCKALTSDFVNLCKEYVNQCEQWIVPQ